MIDTKFTVVFPCYNEEENVMETYARVRDVMENSNLTPFELIFIDDGSEDKTFNLLEELATKDNRVKVISFSRNFGHESATTAGLNFASGEYVFLIDADLQDPPELFPQMYGMLRRENANCVYGVRKKRKGESFLKKFTSSIFYRFYNAIAEIKFPADTGDFRIIDKKILDEFNLLPENNVYVRGLLTWVGFKQIPLKRKKKG